MLNALIILPHKCHNILKHSFNENIKELDYLLISYWNWNVLHYPHSAFSTPRTPRFSPNLYGAPKSTRVFPQRQCRQRRETLGTRLDINADWKKKLSNLQIYVLNSRFLFLYYKLYGNLVKCLLSFLYFVSYVEECVVIAKKIHSLFKIYMLATLRQQFKTSAEIFGARLNKFRAHHTDFRKHMFA